MFEVFGTSSCHFCAMAREVLENWGKEYNYIDVGENADIQKAFFTKFNNTKIVPQIVDEQGHHIGGYVELREWLKDYG